MERKESTLEEGRGAGMLNRILGGEMRDKHGNFLLLQGKLDERSREKHPMLRGHYRPDPHRPMRDSWPP